MLLTGMAISDIATHIVRKLPNSLKAITENCSYLTKFEILIQQLYFNFLSYISVFTGHELSKLGKYFKEVSCSIKDEIYLAIS